MSTPDSPSRSNRHYARWYVCHQCGKRYVKRTYWVRHLQSHARQQDRR